MSKHVPAKCCRWLQRITEKKKNTRCRCQVLPAGPPVGAGESGSADQRKQEERPSGEMLTLVEPAAPGSVIHARLAAAQPGWWFRAL